MNKMLKFILIIILYSSTPLVMAENYDDKIMAIVNDKVILKSEVQLAIDYLPPDIVQKEYIGLKDKEVIEKVLTRLIETSLLIQAADRYGITISDIALENKISEIVTLMVHSEQDLNNAIKASKVLFGKSSKEDLESLDEKTFNEIFEGVPSSIISLEKLSNEIDIENLLSLETNFLKSISDARRSLKENSISVNKNKIKETYKISKSDLINNKYVLLQRGRKNYHLVIFN